MLGGIHRLEQVAAVDAEIIETCRVELEKRFECQAAGASLSELWQDRFTRATEQGEVGAAASAGRSLESK